MKYHKLPHSSLEVSKICLGTMTFGEQNSQAEAFNQLDYAIDLYQIHWPQRETNTFGQLNYPYPDAQQEVTLIETLEAMAELIKAGKIRYIGVSNETPWGVMSLLKLADKHDLPRIVSIQNPYNLLNRSFEVGLSEISHFEGVELLAYSPLAFGCLSGKYLNGQRPVGARCSLFERFVRYFTPQGIAATQAYVEVAQKHGLDPAQMALAFVNQRPFVAANIIGATTMEQLKANIDSIAIELSDELLKDIQAVGTTYSNPCP
ncbi:aldo/keto reductase [Vibrio rhodolitus]|uniref:aldo/keto reductase n=1 Tax=Vibrio rhodolitus TaxID=2231649 RepID=UPI000E0BECDF|nr:aldo/keto reductase [Vibrio rhodolitus]